MSVANRKLCPGYPPYGCETLIDPAKELCQFCARTKEIEARKAKEARLVAAQAAFRKAENRLDRARASVEGLPQPKLPEIDQKPPVRIVEVERPVFGQPDTWHPMTEVVEIVAKEVLPSCPCGGMADAELHEDSMLHRQWLISHDPRPRSGNLQRTHWPKGANQ